jgi:sulfoxide reductase heme-binding subunit YedZ
MALAEDVETVPRDRRWSRWFNGWRLTVLLTVVVAVFTITAAVQLGGVDGANRGIRLTARTSLVLFLSAFTASSLYHLWPTPATKWIRRNRRYLGVAFAGSHFIHAAFIVTTIVLNAHRFDIGFERTPKFVYVVDTFGYLSIIAMTITSFDPIARKMKYANWKRLHLTGSYIIWFTFFFAYWRRGVAAPEFYGLLLLACIAALIIRFIAKSQLQRARRH